MIGGLLGAGVFYLLAGKLPITENHFEPALTSMILGGLAGLMDSVTKQKLGLVRSLLIVAGIGLLTAIVSIFLSHALGWDRPPGFATDRFAFHRLCLRLFPHVGAVALLLRLQRQSNRDPSQEMNRINASSHR